MRPTALPAADAAADPRSCAGVATPPVSPQNGRLLFDTSVFIAREQSRPLVGLPPDAEVAVSIVTLAELRLGVLMAADMQGRSDRLGTYEAASAFDPLLIDRDVAEHFAELAARALAAGRRKVKVQDTWIAATALANDAAVATQDDDFDDFDRLTVVRV